MSRIRTVAVAMLALAATAGSAFGQSTINADQIEEDWKVVIATPDTTGGGPQISTCMSPVSDKSSPCFIFDLNYRESPTFSPGGMEVQVWTGDTMVNCYTQGSGQCATVGETITWTQRIRLSSGTISFAIDSGRSTTWGKFGQGQQLNIGGTFATNLTTLSGYTPAASVASSGVGWQRNRVTSMTLLQVRYYAGGKLLATDTQARTIDLSK